MNIFGDWDQEEVYYLVEHMKVLGLEGANQVADRLGRSVHAVRYKYIVETEKTHHHAG